MRACPRRRPRPSPRSPRRPARPMPTAATRPGGGSGQPAPAPSPPRPSGSPAARRRHLRSGRRRAAQPARQGGRAAGRPGGRPTSAQADSDGRVQQLEHELATPRHVELETRALPPAGRTTRSSSPCARRVNRKDKEILRLKSELNEKEQEIVELRTSEMRARAAGHRGLRRDRSPRRADQDAHHPPGAAHRGASARWISSCSRPRRRRAPPPPSWPRSRRSSIRHHAQVDASTASWSSCARPARRAQSAVQAGAGAARRAAASEADQCAPATRTPAARPTRPAPQLDQRRRSWTRTATSWPPTGGGDTPAPPLVELEESASQHEERLTKLYERMKGDEEAAREDQEGAGHGPPAPGRSSPGAHAREFRRRRASGGLEPAPRARAVT